MLKQADLPEELCFRFSMATFTRRQAEARLAGVRDGVHTPELARQAVLDYLKADSEWAEAFAQIVVLADSSVPSELPEKVEYAIYNATGVKGKGRYQSLGEVASVLNEGGRPVVIVTVPGSGVQERWLSDTERDRLNDLLTTHGKPPMEA